MKRFTLWPPRSLWRLGIVLLFVVALLGGCSMVRLGYGQLDTVAAWMADDYFDLDAQQKDEFVKRFDRLHEWHRYEQLPDYAAFLSQARTRVQQGLTRDDVWWFIEGFRARYRTIVRRGSNDAAALLLTISPPQLDALQRQFDKDNRKFSRDYRIAGSAEEIKHARARRMLDQVKDWVGRLSDEQERRIVTMVNALPMTEQLRYEDRVRRQGEFLQLMGQRGNREEFAAKLRDSLIHWEKGRAPEYESRFNEWMDQRVLLLIEIDRMITPAQRTAVQQRLKDYVDDFTKLAERPGQPAARR
jgi:hypothetical protein